MCPGVNQVPDAVGAFDVAVLVEVSMSGARHASRVCLSTRGGPAHFGILTPGSTRLPGTILENLTIEVAGYDPQHPPLYSPTSDGP